MPDYNPRRVTMNNTTIALTTFQMISEICDKTSKPRGVVLDVAIPLLYRQFIEAGGILPSELPQQAAQ